jgi:transposase-like protein
VDQQGHILNSLVTARRDTQAATRFFRQVLKRC